MNTQHYPSIELCQKLSEIGFPKTELSYFLSVGMDIDENCIPKKPEYYGWKIIRGTGGVDNPVVCPSVMEMLDVIPKKLTLIEEWNEKYEYGFLINKTNSGNFRAVLKMEFIGTLPNALADLIIWLVENFHINFKSHDK